MGVEEIMNLFHETFKDRIACASYGLAEMRITIDDEMYVVSDLSKENIDKFIEDHIEIKPKLVEEEIITDLKSLKGE